DLAVIEPTADGLVLRERAPGISLETILGATDAALIVPDDVPEMRLS
ncbi:MAG: succinyl-CoA--3-ketoacid-CoA transferase, partial [Hyphomicrobiales bacterium]|nr:succinyl-CoA--3-ketoacid-CoA transferase [Hyphomicrobiales bacterium]